MKKNPPFLNEPWPPVLTADEAAVIFRRSTKTVQRYVARGLIKGIDAPGPYLISADALTGELLDEHRKFVGKLASAEVEGVQINKILESAIGDRRLASLVPSDWPPGCLRTNA